MASNEAQKSPILKTSMVAKATLDPFLYCVYHKDLYPAAKDDTMEAPREGDGQDFNPIAPYRMYHGKRIPGMLTYLRSSKHWCLLCVVVVESSLC